MISNYDDVLDQLLAAGLVFESRDLPLETGRMRRVKVEGERERKGWYILHELRLDNGETVLVGSFGVWRGLDNNAQKVELRKQELTPEQKAALKARQDEDRRRSDAARKAEAEKAARAAEKAWKQCEPSGACDYLTRKGVKGHGTRFTKRGNLVIPIHDGQSKIHGLQIIYGNKAEKDRKGRDKDYWPAGLTKKGHFFLIGSPTNLVLVAEGYATAASLHEATGHPVAVAFDAGNLLPVSQALRKRYRGARILICADDDFATQGNPGVTAASAAALAVDGAWLAPVFDADPLRAAVAAIPQDAPDWREQARAATTGRSKLTDFNDLHTSEGLHLVRAQIEAKLQALGWTQAESPRARAPQGGGGAMPSMLSVDDAVERYWGTYGLGGKTLFDEVERRLVHRDDVMNLLPPRSWDLVKSHPKWRVARDTEIGFDPTESDRTIRCNLWGGWPTTPKAGKCTILLELLEYLCSNEDNSREVYQYILKWLAYPLQHPGAKMHSAIVVHGPQGTGKSRFFEAYCKIFGRYGRVLGQEALEDKFNADWAEAKLFILADEVLARQDMYHIKNRLKGFVTGETIRVNPKNVAAHNEKNHMNIVFLSNERQPLVLENDDRRHCVIWVPPKLDMSFFTEINDEIANGGIAALHHYLLGLDLTGFNEWSHPPMTRAKEDLVELGRSSEERFLREWIHLELENSSGDTIPFCPCMGSHLYRVYEGWCERHGERKRGMKDLISLAGKMPGWTAGSAHPTWATLQDRTTKNRKMIVPAEADLIESVRRCRTGEQAKLLRERFSTKAEWLTACHFAFELAVEGAHA